MISSVIEAELPRDPAALLARADADVGAVFLLRTADRAGACVGLALGRSRPLLGAPCGLTHEHSPTLGERRDVAGEEEQVVGEHDHDGDPRGRTALHGAGSPCTPR